ncbi:MAG: hypothetical protein ABS36_08695 [Acidobacteria bacterium SCN 69-37]|nr:MAG: hypothetical protein ABS36_08695 [Acidobacteria bacterium SCN 69-37]
MTDDPQLLILFEQIAFERLGIQSLRRSGRDFNDFHDVSVWGLLAALEDAYAAGMRAGRRSP